MKMNSGCEGPLKHEVVHSAEMSGYPASNVLSDDFHDWLAEGYKTTGQGFTIKVDNCPRLIIGCKIKNKERGYRATKDFRVSGSVNESGPWQIILEDELIDTRHSNNDAELINFTFDHPVKIQFLKFELISYWGDHGGALNYFAAIRVKSKIFVKLRMDLRFKLYEF